jgi:hypothetical protein
MDTAMQILVIIVSATLTLFLVVAIFALVYIIKIVKSLQRVTDKAEELVDKAEMVGELVGKAAGPVAIGRLITNVADTVFKKGKHGKGSDK